MKLRPVAGAAGLLRAAGLWQVRAPESPAAEHTPAPRGPGNGHGAEVRTALPPASGPIVASNSKIAAPNGRAATFNGKAATPNGDAAMVNGKNVSANGKPSVTTDRTTAPNGHSSHPNGRSMLPNGQRTPANVSRPASFNRRPPLSYEKLSDGRAVVANGHLPGSNGAGPLPAAAPATSKPGGRRRRRRRDPARASPTSLVEFSRVSLRYGSATAIADMGCAIAPGELVFLVGPSGAGKTSLLRMIIGEVRPSGGHLWVDGVPMHRASSRGVQRVRRRVGVVFEDYKLLEHKTALENVCFALHVADLTLPLAEARTIAMAKLRQVGLSRRANAFPSQLSAGQRQRVAVARALAATPQLLLADEPTANLDAVRAAGVLELLTEIARTGTTVLVATHDRDLAARSKARTLSLRDGRVTRDLRPAGRQARIT